MVELTYTSVLGADAARIEGLNPSYGTNLVWVGSLAVRSGRACARYHPLEGVHDTSMPAILGSLERVQRAFVSRVSYAAVVLVVSTPASQAERASSNLVGCSRVPVFALPSC